MTRSVEELRRDSEQSRAQLAATVDRLREQIADTAEDIRYKVSPENIKAEVSGFISHKTHGWMDALKQQAMDNPMQAIAAGTAIAVPAMRLARGFPLPLLMIGAGLALSSKTVRDRAAEAAAPGIEKAREVIDEASERAQSLGDDMRKAMSHAERQAAGMAGEARESAGGMADAASGMAGDLRDRATQAADAVVDKVRSGMDAASEMAKEADGACSLDCERRSDGAPATASKVIRDNAVLIGSLGWRSVRSLRLPFRAPGLKQASSAMPATGSNGPPAARPNPDLMPPRTRCCRRRMPRPKAFPRPTSVGTPAALPRA
jgi:hypothetical protein